MTLCPVHSVEQYRSVFWNERLYMIKHQHMCWHPSKSSETLQDWSIAWTGKMSLIHHKNDRDITSKSKGSRTKNVSVSRTIRSSQRIHVLFRNRIALIGSSGAVNCLISCDSITGRVLTNQQTLRGDAHPNFLHAYFRVANDTV